MSKDEIKSEINKVLDYLPDNALKELLAFLKSIEGASANYLFSNTTLDKLLQEDKTLLEKLAQ